MMAKGTFARITFPSGDLDGDFERLQRPTSTWSKSRPTSPTGSATPRSAIPPAT